LTKKVNIS